jgi:YegS/Rv2252/BmrU family lipid kinase
VKRLLLIPNADAGAGEPGGIEEALGVLQEGADVEVHPTASQGDLDLVLTHREDREVIVAGGDGSLHAVVAALHRRGELDKTVLGLLPVGTGNDFARGASIPLDAEEAARLVLTATPKPVDLILDSAGGVVVNHVHIGIGAEASRHAHAWKSRFGRVGYLFGTAIASFKPPYMRLRVEVDGEVVADVDRRLLQVAIGNGSSVGGGTDLTPDADPSDGRIDVMISFAVGPLARIAYAFHLRRGEHEDRDDVRSLRAQTVSVTGPEFFCSADGELYGPETSMTWHIERAAFQMLLPD